MRTAIRRVTGRRVWDSRGRPTVEAEVELECGAIERAMAPAGASTGSGEAVDLRDEDGVDVRRAVANINETVARALVGVDAADQENSGLRSTPSPLRRDSTYRARRRDRRPARVDNG